MKTVILFFAVFFLALTLPLTVKANDTLTLMPLEINRKIDRLINLARYYSDSSSLKSMEYASAAVDLSKKKKDPSKIAEACLLLANAYLKQQMPGKALPLATEACSLYKITKSVEGEIKATSLLGSIEMRKGDLAAANRDFEAAMKLCLNSMDKNPSNKKITNLTVNALSNIARLSVREGKSNQAIVRYKAFLNTIGVGSKALSMSINGLLAEFYRSAGSYDTATIYANRAMDLAQVLNDSVYLAKLIGMLANISYNQGHYAEALSYNLQTEAILKKSHNPRDLPYVYNNIASIYQNTSNLSLAAYYFLKSLQLKEESHDSVGIAVTLGNLGLVYKNWGDYPKALEYLNKAVSINKAMNNKPALAITFNNLGDFYFLRRLGDSALYYFNTALEYKKTLKDRYGMIVALDGIGRTYSQLLGKPALSIKYFNEGEALANSIKTDYWLANINMDMGEAYLGLKKPAAAREMFEKGLAYARKEQVYDLMQDALKPLLEISIKAGDASSSLRYLTEFCLVNDSAFSAEKARVTMEMLTRFETEKKEKENMILKKNGDIQQLQISKKNFQIAALLALAFSLLVFGLIIFWLFRQKDKAYRLIVQQHVDIVRAEELLKFKPTVHNAEGESDKEAGIDEEKTQAAKLLAQLMWHFEKDKPYLDPGLTLEDICKKINTNRTYLSNLINEECQKNFHIFITEYRIKEARRLLVDTKCSRYTIEEIGKMAGFGTKASFHGHFKSQIGVTPAYFREHASSVKDSSS